MATDLEQRTTTEQQTRRGFFSSMNISGEDTQYCRPNFSAIDFEDASNISSEKHYDSRVETITVDNPRKLDMLTIDKAIEQHPQAPIKVTLNARGRIIVSVIAICICALMAFMIGNAVAIGNLNYQINQQQEIVYQQQETVNGLQQEYDALTNGAQQAAIDSGYTQTIENAYSVDEVLELNRAETEIPGNWFDNLCNFLSNLFN